MGFRFSLWGLAPLAVLTALVTSLVSFIILIGITPLVPSQEIVVVVLCINGAMSLILLGIIGREVWRIVKARRRGRAAARLHVRIVGLFGIVAVVPALLVALLASITLDRGLDRWFSVRTRAIVDNAVSVAQTYVREHAYSIRGDVMGMARDLQRIRPLWDTDRSRFRQAMTAQAVVRGLPAAMVIQRDLAVVDRTTIRTGREFVVPSNLAVKDATEEQPLIYLPTDADFVGAVIPLKEFGDLFLYVARPIDPRVINYLKETQAAVADYRNLEQQRIGVQVAFALLYAVISLTVLLCAVWLGIHFANRLVAPIRRLIGAADLVAAGNLYVEVPVRRTEGDLSSLAETFNKMTQELRTQQNDLVQARDQIDTRRRFTEAVLSGVGAGVIGVDSSGSITIINRPAEKMLGVSEDDALGKPLGDIVPEIAPMLVEAMGAGPRTVQGNTSLSRDGRDRVIAVRFTTEQSREADHGWVVTLDDITELVVAQRSSAWADIARRIAHEIKNPLTPIQLSAERLRRRYGKVIGEDREVFDQCTDTIIRQVGDIGRMVDEFSSFARMPKPVVEEHDVAETVRQVVFLMRVGNPEIDIRFDAPEGPVSARFDRRLISQALTNIVKNATEALEGIAAEDRVEPPRITVELASDERNVTIDVIDNGKGLPTENRARLLEPYVTTREKGTGLGLAIVGKIMEEHGGGIELADAPEGRGAWIRLRFLRSGAGLPHLVTSDKTAPAQQAG
ncbi:two-component system nitrogen regulation sensor histidine kinase NtrY [Ancylobacter sp. 3268]|uniref:sensor histidine kinase NtrY-like n=1 Tax=Ancylobacter sp. 3268 TaxID=2817752 RepID=UPI002864EFC1|nr:PAS domain-containing sensor histidine kinase [Ancylobacter sp. 3268]MDR6951028.1 two-component system nitrogen regulation sensor histidine kinase NtrY [Ancylobacter sp. 3268]